MAPLDPFVPCESSQEFVPLSLEPCLLVTSMHGLYPLAVEQGGMWHLWILLSLVESSQEFVPLSSC